MLRQAGSMFDKRPIFAENRDFVTAIFDDRLRMVAQTAYIPVLLGSTPFAVQATQDRQRQSMAHQATAREPTAGESVAPWLTIRRAPGS